MDTQDGLGLWGYHDNAKSLCFQKPVDIKKSRGKKNLIFKYIVENTHLKKSYQIYIGTLSVFLEIEPREGTSESRERVIVVHTLKKKRVIFPFTEVTLSFRQNPV